MSVKGHPMSHLKGTQAGKDLMNQVRAHKGAAAPAKVGSDPGDAANTAGSDYADPGYQPDGLKRYPLDTAAHVQAAASYFGNPNNRAKYSPAERKHIDRAIQAAKDKQSKPISEQDVARRFMAARGNQP